MLVLRFGRSKETIIKTIIAGSRGFCDAHCLMDTLNTLPWKISEVVSGRARGADRLGEMWAKQQQLPCHLFPADWTTYGKGAGVIRNKQMAEYADAAVIFWDGSSRGSQHMISMAQQHNLTLKIILYRSET